MLTRNKSSGSRPKLIRRPKRRLALLGVGLFAQQELFGQGQLAERGERGLVITFVEAEDSVVHRLVREFAEMEEGNHAAFRQFLQRAYAAALRFQDEPEEFERLTSHPFWGASRQGSKDASTSKWLLYFIMRASAWSVCKRARKYAVILDGLMRAKVKSGEVAARIKEMGGIQAAYEAMQTQARKMRT
jgi:hypothetical protein